MSQVIRNFTTVAEVTVVGSIHGQETVNVWHFGRETPWNVDTIIADLVALCQALAQCIVDTLLPAVTSDWRFLRIKARTILGGESDEVEVPAQGNAIGQLGAASHSFACALLNLKTGGGGRSGRGKKFLPPVGEANVTASEIDPATLVLLAAFIACLVEKFFGNPAESGWNVVVWSRKNNSAREVKSIIPSPHESIMGTRRIGRGN